MAKGIKPPKPKTCRICKTKFTPRNTTQIVCSPICAIQHAKKQSERKQKQSEASARREWNKRKADVKPLSHWITMTQRAFNDYIRARDEGCGCISCGSTTATEYHAGHYRTTAAASHLRFNEDGCHLQCASCNVHHSGAITQYRLNLISKIGLERVVALENDNTPHRYTRDELNAIRARYRAKLREMKKLQEAA
ncbi:recombination protein NinG [Serratia entomophila]|uniref:recombination protein NinG n=1 Tax=Serratia entomophila TaxID=42906 RepID=UPI00217AA117|nr:recombination protein NinG [Serratia entomophila]CAI0819023.1 Bacteriophage Lambda NinG protein [Serratia entomophila]CAI0842632.1 Bacteriophage Lambda NinG protein [Serratia entomophila]CAI0878931.1 Bacteriophage Lambda NinG protein [Serratia entomophila]CAI1781953.1 Bacteriophage Lambda NinG protein [Serratia entomophila]CAI1952561.1 Bacteriophage Lambda NinG protein [Serratia entomophila]